MTKHEILKVTFGYDAFREGQEPLIDRLLAHGEVVGVMPTGAGKSLCYQVPALMLDGITIVVSPLISLMKDQVAALKAAGVAAAYINSSLTPGQQTEALRRAALGYYKIIYVAPERLDVGEFLRFALEAPIALLAVDEAHCVSQWGQDFRPSYLKIADFIEKLPNRPAVGAFTATATPQVKTDIVKMLRLREPLVKVTGFDRPNLRFTNLKPRDKYAALLEVLDKHERDSGVIYCSTRKNVEEVCSRLCADGYDATRYHAGLNDRERHTNQDDFQYDRAKIMVATNAFGMGIDKSNVAFVVHYNMPKNLESYYQEAGRAGRDGSAADCVLLYSGQDVITARWMLDHSEENPDLTAAEQAAIYQRDQERLKQMTFYSTSRRCLRKFILNYFGESAPERCENCSVCSEEPFEVGATAAKSAVKAAKHAKQRHVIPTESDNPDLFDKLKTLRAKLASKKHVPAYVVFSDASLRDMASVQPHTWDDFLEISGVGETKRDQYGDAFLGLICEHDGVVYEPHAPEEDDEPNFDDRWDERDRGNAGQPWTDDEDERLREEFEGGADMREICDEHERSIGAIRARLRRLGLVE